MKNRKIKNKKKVTVGREGDIEDNEMDYRDEIEHKKLNTNSIGRILYWLPEEERLRILDLNWEYHQQAMKYYTNEITDDWVDFDNDSVYEMDELIIRYSKDITSINLSNHGDLDHYTCIIELCSKVSKIKVEESDVNDLLCLIYEAWKGSIKSISLGTCTDEESEDLQQVPNYPNLESLSLFRILIYNAQLNDVFFFVPENLCCIYLDKLDYIDSSTVSFIINRFPKLENITLISDNCNESALLEFNKPLPYLKELGLGEINELSKLSMKFKLQPKYFPKLKTFKIFGSENMENEEGRLPNLLSAPEYLFEFISLTHFNLLGDYKFFLQKYPYLTHLQLDNCSNLNTEKILFLFQNPRLILLSLNSCDIHDDHFAALVKRKKNTNFESNLHSLSLSQNMLGFNFLVFLFVHMVHLVKLDITYCKTNKEFTVHDLTLITKLDINQLKIEELKVKGSFVNNLLLQALVKTCPNLQLLQVDDETKATEYLESKRLLTEETVVCEDSD